MISGFPISGEPLSGTPGASPSFIAPVKALGTYTVMGVQGAPFRPPFGIRHNFIFVSSTVGMNVGDTIEIMMDNGEFFRTKLVNVTGANQILIANPLPFRASAGNIVIDLTKTVTVAPSRAENSTDLGG